FRYAVPGFVAETAITVDRSEIVEHEHELRGLPAPVRIEGADLVWNLESPLLDGVLRQSVLDLAALRITGELLGETYVLPAAGLPWFMTLFGRDTLITSLQTLWVGPGLARGALHLLGALQGTRSDDF